MSATSWHWSRKSGGLLLVLTLPTDRWSGRQRSDRRIGLKQMEPEVPDESAESQPKRGIRPDLTNFLALDGPGSFPRPARCRDLVFRLVHKLFPNKSNDLSPRNFTNNGIFPCGESLDLRLSHYRQASPDDDGCKALRAGAKRIGTSVPGREAKVQGLGKRRRIFGFIFDGIGTLVVAW